MGSFLAEETRFIYKDNETSKVLLDFNDFMSNKSRIPFHSAEGYKTIPDIIEELMDEHIRVSEGTKDQKYLALYTMFDVLLFRFLVADSKPRKLLEVGADDGILSVHISRIMDLIHPDSEYYKVNMTETGILQLVKDKSTDIVVINGNMEYECPDGIIKEIKRIHTDTGMIMCISNVQNTLFKDMFLLLNNNIEKYYLDDGSYVFVA